jgi:hypothetical protein
MVSIAPNQFRIEGTVVSIEKEAQLENFVNVSVQLEKVEHLLGPAEFLDPSTQEIDISVPDTLAISFKEGMYIECKIRKAPGHFFVIPDSLKTGEKK